MGFGLRQCSHMCTQRPQGNWLRPIHLRLFWGISSRHVAEAQAATLVSWKL